MRAPTCICPQGSSVIDITLASPLISRIITNWKVLLEYESLSDHRYISFDLDRPALQFTRARRSLPRWLIKSIDDELFRESLEWACSNRSQLTSANQWISWIGNIMSLACNASMRRYTSSPNRPHSFWWNEEVAEARRTAIGRRKSWIRARGSSSPSMDEKYQLYRAARNSLHLEIKKAKAKAWADLLLTVEEDSWGLPYKLVMGRLRSSNSSLSATLLPEALERLINSLFPPGETCDPPCRWPNFVWDDSMAISVDETLSVLKNIGNNKRKNLAPGPDGIGLSIWRRIPRSMIECLSVAFNYCLKEGYFPHQ